MPASDGDLALGNADRYRPEAGDRAEDRVADRQSFG